MDLCGGKLMPGTESGTSLIVDRELPSAGPAAQAYPCLLYTSRCV